MAMRCTKSMRTVRNVCRKKTVQEAETGVPDASVKDRAAEKTQIIHRQEESKRMPPRLRGREPLAEAAASAAAQKKDDPDPVTAVSTAKAEAIIMFTATSASIVAASAAAAQNQNQPDNIASGSSPVTIAVAVTSAVCCCQIAHTNSSNNYLQFIICRPACHSFRFFGKFSKKNPDVQSSATGSGSYHGVKPERQKAIVAD